VINEHPDAKALWIVFKGREYVVMWYPNNYFAYPVDNGQIQEKEIRNLFRYLGKEGFMNDNEKPPQLQTH